MFGSHSDRAFFQLSRILKISKASARHRMGTVKAGKAMDSKIEADFSRLTLFDWRTATP